MPTNNRRIQVMLEPDTIDAIERYAAVTGQSLSSVCGSILNVQAPALFKLASVMEASQTLTDRARTDLRASLQQSVEQSEAAAEEMLAMVSELLNEVQGSASSDRTARRAKARAGEARGVRP